MSKSDAVIVLGMHRSGTSAISGELSKLGCFMGRKLFKAQSGVNEKGFFENSEIVKINEYVFDTLRSSWDDPLFHITTGQTSLNQGLEKYKDRAVQLIKSEYKSQPFWGMKDPRTSILIDFWQSVFNCLDMHPKYIVMVRHPAEVYMSLRKRDSFSVDKALILWVCYTLYSLKYYNESDYAIVTFETLMDPKSQVVANTLDKLFPGNTIDKPETASFITASLKNNEGDFDLLTDGDVRLVEITRQLYTCVTGGNVNPDEIQLIGNAYADYLNTLSVVLREHLSVVKNSEVTYRNLFDAAYYSYWWKATWPLRFLENAFKRN